MEVISFMIVVWMIKVLVEDGWAMAKGQSNPRLDRRRARQKSRGHNPIWNQLVGYLGDVAADARTEQARRREEKRDRAAEERRKRDLEEHPRIDAEYTTTDAGEINPPAGQGRPHEELNVSDCNIEGCPVHHPVRPATQPATQPTTNPSTTNEGDTMSDTTEVQGLDQAIAYADAVAKMAAKHGSAGNEDYVGTLKAAKVSGHGLASAHQMQEAFDNAMEAAAAHKRELAKQTIVQESYDAVADAGDKEFLTSGR